MTQPTKDKLIAARDAVNLAIKVLKENDASLSLDDHLETLKALLDSHINPPDLESLKKDDRDSNAPIEEMLRNEGWNAAIDHLAPRIVREGCVVVPVEPTEKMIEAWDDWNASDPEQIGDDVTGYKAMITASKVD